VPKHYASWVPERQARLTKIIKDAFDEPAPNIEPRFARIEIFETIAIVNLEVQGWSGKLAGLNARISEIFTLLKRDGEWKIGDGVAVDPRNGDLIIQIFAADGVRLVRMPPSGPEQEISFSTGPFVMYPIPYRRMRWDRTAAFWYMVARRIPGYIMWV
jgi:hypothetical protein